MKTIYEFTLDREELVDETATETDAAGQEVKKITRVKKQVPQKFLIKYPSRAINDEAGLFYSVKLSEFIKMGLLTFSQLKAKLSNEGDIVSEEEKKEFTESFNLLFSKETEFQLLTNKELGAEDKEKKEKLIGEIAELKMKLQKIEVSQSALFDHTAEFRARNKTIMWYLFNLSYYDVKGEIKPLFGTGKFEEKEKAYDAIEEGADEILKTASKYLAYLISFWQMDRSKTKEEFDNLFIAIKNAEAKQPA